MTPIADEAFTLDYLADQRLLIARWLEPMELPALKACYEALLSMAQTQQNCRHWLVDIRRRSVGDPAALQWFTGEFDPRLVPTLGGPVFVAYFAMIDQTMAHDNSLLRDAIERGALGGAHYHYFNREDEALAWLTQQP